MKTSSNFGFKLPENSDYYNVEDFNTNFKGIDGLLNNCSEEENGYVYLSKNIVLQWGKIQAKYVGVVENAEFNIPFSKVLNLNINCVYGDGTDADLRDASKLVRISQLPTNTGFSFINTKTNFPVVLWSAIGIIAQ